MKRPKPEDGYKRINLKILFLYIITLIFVQALGVYFLLKNLNLSSAIIGIVVLGFLVPIILAMI
ncbi:MAG: hypothetical protein P8X91_03570, partial [Candidatus Bathyarchaeota archaeon]